MGRVDDFIDPSRLTRSGNKCLEELVYIAKLSHESKISAEWTIISCATAVETHFNRILTTLIDASGISDSDLGSALLNEALDDIFKTWKSRFRWLHIGFGPSIAGDKETQGFMLVVELRNALVHGQGELTSLQQKNLGELVVLKRNLSQVLGVKLRGAKVILDGAVENKTVRLCRRFVMHFDEAVLSFSQISTL